MFLISSYVSLDTTITMTTSLLHRVETISRAVCEDKWYLLGAEQRYIIAFWLAITWLAKWIWLCDLTFRVKANVTTFSNWCETCNLKVSWNICKETSKTYGTQLKSKVKCCLWILTWNKKNMWGITKKGPTTIQTVFYTKYEATILVILTILLIQSQRPRLLMNCIE